MTNITNTLQPRQRWLRRLGGLTLAVSLVGAGTLIGNSDQLFAGSAEESCPDPEVKVPDQVGDFVRVKGTASQSSLAYGGNADRAIDGNADGNFWHNSVTHTRNETNQHWDLKFNESAVIDSIEVFGRNDCCEKRLDDYWIFFSPEPFTTADPSVLAADPTVKGLHVENQPISKGVSGLPGATSLKVDSAAEFGYLRIVIPGRQILSLAEVVAWTNTSTTGTTTTTTTT